MISLSIPQAAALYLFVTFGIVALGMLFAGLRNFRATKRWRSTHRTCTFCACTVPRNDHQTAQCPNCAARLPA